MQFVQGWDLLHFSLRRRHSRHEVIIRMRRRMGLEPIRGLVVPAVEGSLPPIMGPFGRIPC